MKKDIFNQYVSKVCELFDIEPDDLIKKTKERNIVDARQLLFFLCEKRQIKIIYIEKWMNDVGFKVGHSTIIHGIRKVKDRIRGDNDYVSIVKDIERSVF
jgi:hypothetical protein